MPLPQKILNSLFESVTFRTAGFATFSQEGLTDVSCLGAYVLMFIGGSPIGTAGGVKTTTFYLAILGVHSYIRGKNDAYVYKRSIRVEAMRKATAIIEVSVVTVFVLTFLLVATNPVGIEDGLFEIISACATVGLTRGLTPTLNTAGKLIVTVGMYLGRIGPISMAFFLTGGKKNESGVHYAEGNFYIG
jgi:trk system potassium uptake protein TrkH